MSLSPLRSVLCPALAWPMTQGAMRSIILLLCISMGLSACDQGSNNDQNNSNSNQGTKVEEPIAEPVAKPSDHQSVLSPLANIEQEPHTADPKLGPSVESDASSLVEDLGFSGAEPEPIDTNVDSELFCLSESSQTENPSSDVCERISNRLSSVTLAACKAAKLKETGCNSVKGFPIVVREFPPLANRKSNGRILIVGGTHGDELTSVSVTLRWIEKLNQHHSGLYHWHVVPLMNPDGVLKPSATRTNYNGVDLNRNMPSADWSENALKYWTQKGDKDPRKFPGDEAASEPETKWLIDEINTFKPDAIISVHAPYGVVDFDSLVLNSAPKSLGKLHLNLLGTYPGSLGNYAGINRNIPVITLELPHSWVMPSEKETTKIWEDLVSWLRKNISNEELLSSKN